MLVGSTPKIAGSVDLNSENTFFVGVLRSLQNGECSDLQWIGWMWAEHLFALTLMNIQGIQFAIRLNYCYSTEFVWFSDFESIFTSFRQRSSEWNALWCLIFFSFLNRVGSNLVVFDLHIWDLVRFDSCHEYYLLQDRLVLRCYLFHHLIISPQILKLFLIILEEFLLWVRLFLYRLSCGRWIISVIIEMWFVFLPKISWSNQGDQIF